MTLIVDGSDWKDDDAKDLQQTILGTLMVSSMTHNWLEFLEENTFEQADTKMENLFGDSWNKAKEQIWQKLDEEDGSYES